MYFLYVPHTLAMAKGMLFLWAAKGPGSLLQKALAPSLLQAVLKCHQEVHWSALSLPQRCFRGGLKGPSPPGINLFIYYSVL